MNNSFIELQHVNLNMEEEVDLMPSLRAEELKLIKIIQAIETIGQSPEWQNLNKLIFEDQVPNLERMIKNETSQQPINTDKIHSLNGQLAWVKKFTNFSTLADAYRKKLKEVKDKMNAKN